MPEEERVEQRLEGGKVQGAKFKVTTCPGCGSNLQSSVWYSAQGLVLAPPLPAGGGGADQWVCQVRAWGCPTAPPLSTALPPPLACSGEGRLASIVYSGPLRGVGVPWGRGAAGPWNRAGAVWEGHQDGSENGVASQPQPSALSSRPASLCPLPRPSSPSTCGLPPPSLSVFCSPGSCSPVPCS